MLLQILQDALFAAIAAIGFAAISRPPRRAYVWCAVLAAAGHSLRYVLLHLPGGPVHIVAATLIAAFVVGIMAVFISRMVKFPPETCLFPALLPMIPGIYAYKAFGAFVLCLGAGAQEPFGRAFYLFAYNGMICGSILLAMVVGATVPIFIFKKISFQSTR